MKPEIGTKVYYQGIGSVDPIQVVISKVRTEGSVDVEDAGHTFKEENVMIVKRSSFEAITDVRVPFCYWPQYV